MDASSAIAVLALGSNVGDRRAHLRHAIHRLSDAGRLTGVSSVYETEPVGHIDQRTFLNMVVRLVTRLDPDELLDHAERVEAERGRERTFRNAPRTLDIDLLLFDDRVIHTSRLTIPHPRMAERPFVLVPLLELDPGARDPENGGRYADRLAALTGAGGAAAVVRTLSPDQLLEEEDG